MIHLYLKPLRVYILLFAMGAWGLFSGLSLPISLFPMSSQVTLGASVSYGASSAEQFFDTYGRLIESSLQALKVQDVGVQLLRAEYYSGSVQYRVVFDWGADPEASRRDVETKIQTILSTADETVRRSIGVHHWRENGGFYAVSFYSPMRSLDEIFQILQPLVGPLEGRVPDAASVGLYNPNQKEISIILSPAKLAQAEVTTSQVHSSIQLASISLSGGGLKVGEKEYRIDLPKSVLGYEDLGQVRVPRNNKPAVYLKDLAKIEVLPAKNNQQKFKTSGVESLILFANPKDGGNIKNMADTISSELKGLESSWPSDIQYKVLVNPSEFINSSIQGVLHEVGLAAFLAVVVLFLFIGSFKNVITAAIEIPLSLLLAFILMKLTNMNLNLISLGGLALSAGMNVDASVVVLENIFRHFEHKEKGLSFQEKAKILVTAVEEVRLPILASTLASLVVFAPLVFTKGLTNSLLGDLAKAVIFSHGLSAIVALVLVPTIRLHLMRKGDLSTGGKPWIEPLFQLVENFYERALKKFVESNTLQICSFALVAVLLAGLVQFGMPLLKKEVMGRPESDWLIVGTYLPLSASAKEVESEIEQMEQSLMALFSEKVEYTFTQIHGERSGNVMVRLKDKREIGDLVKKAEDLYKNTATKYYWVEQWNPSELSIPDPPDFRFEITGGSSLSRQEMAQDLQDQILSEGIFDKVRVEPNAQKEKAILIKDFSLMGSSQQVLSKMDISHLLRVATDGVYADRVFDKNQERPVYLRFEKDYGATLESLKSLPLGFEGRLIPISALALFSIEPRPADLYRENQRDLFVVSGRLNKSTKAELKDREKKLHERFDEFKAKREAGRAGPPAQDEPRIQAVKPDLELQEAFSQLKWAIALSVLLIFLTMVLQLGDFVQALLVLVAVPLGFIGVVISLLVFGSSLSLNSGLGTILLNGIAVANSIILVDFIQKLHNSGVDALGATLQAAKARLKPILMTSLTTVLGMMPVALGLGEGGGILQPLGIAVCGGLWVSMVLTLFFVPALQYQYLARKASKRGQ